MKAPLKLNVDRVEPESFSPGMLCSTLKTTFHRAQPFPHLVLDEFLSRDLFVSINNNSPFGDSSAMLPGTGREGVQKLKQMYSPYDSGPFAQSLFFSLNSSPFLTFLEAITGYKGLIGDPYFEGGGFHETRAGGYLAMHTDFRVHRKLDLMRRLNLIIYLNEDWDDNYGGHLELGSSESSAPRILIKPVANRAVIFETSDVSLHGHPEPLTCPPVRSRRSVALYYYVASREVFTSIPRFFTQYRCTFRGSSKLDSLRYAARQNVFNFLLDWCPPAVLRALESRAMRKRFK